MELIVAYDQCLTIGDNNTLPWSIPEDLKHFAKLTQNSVVIMGRKTYDSIPNAPLKNRINIVLTKNPNESTNKLVIYTDYSSLFKILDNYPNMKKFVIGGSEIYKLLFDNCNVFHVTLVHNDFSGEVKFPYDLEKHTELTKIDSSEILTSSSGTKYRYIIYKK